MSTGDQPDIFARLKGILPARWFGSPADTSPILDAVLQGIAGLLAFVYSLYAYAKLQTRITTATDGYLDLIAADFFGTTLQRNHAQSDDAYRALILANLFREKATRHAIIHVLEDLTGQAPIIIEPTKPADCGAYGLPFWGYGSESAVALLAAQQIAADNAAIADITGGGADFFFSLFDADNNTLFEGGYGASPPLDSDQLSIASASKMFYAAWVRQQRAYTSNDISLLNMTEGYENQMAGKCQTTDTVATCLATGLYDHQTTGDIGSFSYAGASFQHHGANYTTLTNDGRAALTAAYRNSPTGSPAGLGLTSDTGFTQPLLAGGLQSTARDTRAFCVNILNGTLAYGDELYSRANEVPASTFFNTVANPHIVINSPANPLEGWDYLPGSWRDPTNGYFISAGSFGFIFGLSPDRKYGFVISRAALDAGGEMGSKSITTGRNILNAFFNATAAPKSAGYYGSMRIPYQAFVQAYRPLQNLTIANVSGYGISSGGYNTPSQSSYISQQDFADAISDADIYAAIDSVRMAATEIWVNIQNPLLSSDSGGSVADTSHDRLTEDGQTRLTEDGQTREVE